MKYDILAKIVCHSDSHHFSLKLRCQIVLPRKKKLKTWRQIRALTYCAAFHLPWACQWGLIIGDLRVKYSWVAWCEWDNAAADFGHCDFSISSYMTFCQNSFLRRNLWMKNVDPSYRISAIFSRTKIAKTRVRAVLCLSGNRAPGNTTSSTSRL